MNAVMSFGAVLYGVLLAFLLFLFVVFLLSLLKRPPKDVGFEPHVSVIIPAYNEEKTIGHCLLSLKKTDYPPRKMEIIVADDGSTDKTSSIARQLGARVIKEKHRGKSAALNAGLRAARHDIVLTLDSDTRMEKNCLRKLVGPFSQPDVGAVMGNVRVLNSSTFLGMFQNIEYHLNNLIRNSFSLVFNHSVWFFGAMTCYRKKAALLAGGFSKDTLAEDWDISFALKKQGLRTVSVLDALGHTIAPKTLPELSRQRSRWWIGTLQALSKHRRLFFQDSSTSFRFLFVNQFWWSFYAFASLPLIIYQVNYWFPPPSASALEVFAYLFRWFSQLGPLYVISKIPQWGISLYSIFGVLAGILSAAMIISAMAIFREKPALWHIVALFFFFPYTILLNILIALSIIRYTYRKQRFFIR